jgi:hypothetical protein
MKKPKPTKKIGKQADFVLKPSRLRMALIYALMFGIAVSVGILIRFIMDGGVFDAQRLFGDWQMNALIVLGGAIVFAMLDYRRWTIRVLGGERVEGPSGAFGERQVFSISDIDWTRTRRSMNSRLKIGNGIYTGTRQRILISPWFYDPENFREFAERLGV